MRGTVHVLRGRGGRGQSDGKEAVRTGAPRPVQRPSIGQPKLFVVRLGAGPTLRFGWQIRRAGSVVLSRSEEGYSTFQQAQDAGLQALTSLDRR